MPFAIIGSEEEIEHNGSLIRARIYPWGIAEVDNPKHSDFSILRRALLKYEPSFDMKFTSSYFFLVHIWLI